MFIILEGIATSGKTTLAKELSKTLSGLGLSSEIIGEEKTLMPILDSRSKDVSIRLIDRIIKESSAKEVDVLIFDRLHLTHIFRTDSESSTYQITIEKELLEKGAMIVLLTLKKENIKGRIFGAMTHRNKSWREYVSKKGSDEQITAHYINQQRKLLELIEQSVLPSIIFDTTSKEYSQIINQIVIFAKEKGLLVA